METEPHLPGTTPTPMPSLDELASLRVAAKRIDTLSPASRRWLAQYIAEGLAEPNGNGQMEQLRQGHQA